MPFNDPTLIETLQNNMAGQLAWIKSCQLLIPGHKADGAIRNYPDQGWVVPYFANFAAIALLEDPQAYDRVERYLNWYLTNIEDNGTIMNYHYDPELKAQKTTPDSEDAYAGSYLSLAAAFCQKTGNMEWPRSNLPALKKIAGCVLRLTDCDGLTFVMAGSAVKYLMDNCEVYRGLNDFARLLNELRDPEASFFESRAKAVASGVEKQLWNWRKKCYHPSKTGWWWRPFVNLKKFYPDATCQLFPALYGIIAADSDKGTSLYALFNSYQPDWPEIKPPEYPWMILGYCAALQGDYQRAYDKLRHVRREYIDAKSGNWYCAEAAFYVLTCANLLHRIMDQH